MDKQLNNLLALQEGSMLFGMNGVEHGKFPAGFMGIHNLLHVQDRKAVGVDAQSVTSGAWRTRDLNTIVTNTISGSSLVANRVTLPPGTYYTEGSVPFYSVSNGVQRARASLYNVTAASHAVLSETNCIIAYTAGNSIGGHLHLGGSFTIAVESVFEVQNLFQATGLGGLAGLDAFQPIFTDLKIWKLA
jgi:hypothetical protein